MAPLSGQSVLARRIDRRQVARLKQASCLLRTLLNTPGGADSRLFGVSRYRSEVVPDIDPGWFSAAATLFAAVTTGFAYKLQRDIARTRQALLKGDVLLKRMQYLIAIFADIHATAKEEWSDERSKKLADLSKELRYSKTVIKSLHPSTGEKIECWHSGTDKQHDSIPRVIEYTLGEIGANIADKYDEFLFAKSEELRKIQDDLFKEMGA